MTCTLTLIARNEAANLPLCLGCAAGLFSEIIVLDTGSTDQTREVARSLGTRVFDFPWPDSFVRRNHGRGK
jgi:glycosyltransferase involved in cell wall biosynthesis